MAASVLTVTVKQSGLDKLGYEVTGKIAVGAGDYATGGNTLSFALSDIKAQRLPEIVEIMGQAGFKYEYAPGTTNANGKMLIRQQSAATSALTELPAAAMPAGVTGDTIVFRAVWKGML